MSAQIIARMGMSAVLALLLSQGVGCVSSTVGNPIDSNKVNQIQKHVTTRQQVQQMFGEPTNVSLGADGNKVLSYVYAQTNAQADASSYIPIYGIFAGTASGKQHIQQLQVIVNKNDVVEDYSLEDKVQDIKSTGGVYNQHVRVTEHPATAPATKPATNPSTAASG